MYADYDIIEISTQRPGLPHYFNSFKAHVAVFAILLFHVAWTPGKENIFLTFRYHLD